MSSDLEKNLLDDSPIKRKSGKGKNHALMERLNRVKTPTNIPLPQKDERLEKEVESLKETLRQHEESLKDLEERMTKKEKVDESCCIGYCTIL